MTRKTINTSRTDIHCDVCGRTLLRGENSETYIDGGTRREVCDLCTARAQHEGWVREDDLDRVTERQVSGERRRSLFGRLRGRRETRAEQPTADAYPSDGTYAPGAPYGRPPGMRKVDRIERIDDDPDEPGYAAYPPPAPPAAAAQPEAAPEPHDDGLAYEDAEDDADNERDDVEYEPDDVEYEEVVDEAPAGPETAADADPALTDADPALTGRGQGPGWTPPPAEEYDVDHEYPDEPGYVADEAYARRDEDGAQDLYTQGHGDPQEPDAGYADDQHDRLPPPAPPARYPPEREVAAPGYADADADPAYVDEDYDDDLAGDEGFEHAAPENEAGAELPPAPVASEPAEAARQAGERDPRGREQRGQRHVHAVPMTAGMKMQRALSAFNSSEHVRTVGGLARTLGAPIVAVRPSPTRGSVVGIVVAWELSWYRFEVELADDIEPVTIVDRGDELEELPEEDRVANALVHEDGALELASGP